MKNIDSLRSSLAKNAMIAMMEMLFSMKKMLDPEVENLLTRLIKKSMDTNNFISEEVRKCTASLCLNCSDSKILPTLLSFKDTKSAPCKVSMAYCFEAMIDKNGAKILQIKDFDKFLTCLANLVCDGSLEVRQGSKKAFALMIKLLGDSKEVIKVIQRNVNETVLNKIKQFLDKEINTFDSSPGTIAASLVGGTHGIYFIKAA